MKQCRDCKYFSFDMDLDPFCVHPKVTKIWAWGHDIMKERDDTPSEHPYHKGYVALCGFEGKLYEARNA